MTWTAYQVSFRLLSPLHIGWRKLGNLQQTRPYVTGRSLWGALTARLTREQSSSKYKEVGDSVDGQLAFTYLYPSTEQDEVPLWPWPDQWDEFAWTFLGSYASTALENGRNAEAGSLHETEYIAPYTRDERPVYLVGYIFEKDNCQLDWQSIRDKLQLGGERGYGWGRVHLKEINKQANNAKCFNYEPVYTNDHVLLKASEDSQLLAHTIANGADGPDAASERGVAIEPLLGRETKGDTGFGRSFSTAEICWVPGGKVTKGETFQIQPKGIWEQ